MSTSTSTKGEANGRSRIVRGRPGSSNGQDGPTRGGGIISGGRVPARKLRTRTRSRGLIVAAALAVVGMGFAVAYVYNQAGDKTDVLAIGVPVAKGQIVERSDLVAESVAGVAGAVPVTDLDQVVGKTAAVDLVAGQILTDPMVTSAPVPGAGQALIGLSLDPTRVPSAGLDPGDDVDVIAVPATNGAGNSVDAQGAQEAAQGELDKPAVLSDNATVYAVSGTATDGGQVLITLVVDSGSAARLAAYSTSGRIAVVETSSADAQKVTTGQAGGS